MGELKASHKMQSDMSSSCRISCACRCCVPMKHLLQDLLNGAKQDTDHVKRIVLACERDMEDRLVLVTTFLCDVKGFSRTIGTRAPV